MMNLVRHTRSVPERVSFRTAALLLAVLVVSQLLPVTLTAVPFPDGEREVPTVSLRPLQVCDSEMDFSGFLADHPWVSVTAFAPLIGGTETAQLQPPLQALPEGVPSDVFRPPRTVLS